MLIHGLLLTVQSLYILHSNIKNIKHKSILFGLILKKFKNK